jgi:serine/threonine protein kinase
MAPEQARGDGADGRTDIYALWCVLYEAITGLVRFERDGDLEKLWAHVHDAPPSVRAVRPDSPQALTDVLGEPSSALPSTRRGGLRISGAGRAAILTACTGTSSARTAA